MISPAKIPNPEVRALPKAYIHVDEIQGGAVTFAATKVPDLLCGMPVFDSQAGLHGHSGPDRSPTPEKDGSGSRVAPAVESSIPRVRVREAAP